MPYTGTYDLSKNDRS